MLDRARLALLLARQQDVIARSQAISCGMSMHALRHRLRSGDVRQRLLPGVYLAGTGSPGIDQRDIAALLYVGPSSVRRPEAAGHDRTGRRYVDVLVPVARRRRSLDFARGQRMKRMPDLVCASGRIQFTMAARAVADAARGTTRTREVRAVVVAARLYRWGAAASRALRVVEAVTGEVL